MHVSLLPATDSRCCRRVFPVAGFTASGGIRAKFPSAIAQYKSIYQQQKLTTHSPTPH